MIGVPTDVGDEGQVHALADAAIAEYGGVHVLVNNAGVFAPGYMWDISAEDWKWVMDVNLWGPIHAIRAFVPHMLSQEEGHVVNVSSAGGLMPAGVHGPYCTTKHGVVGLSKALRADLAIKGANIGVTLVCPGAVKTPITSQIQTTGPGGVPRERSTCRPRSTRHSARSSPTPTPAFLPTASATWWSRRSERTTSGCCRTPRSSSRSSTSNTRT